MKKYKAAVIGCGKMGIEEKNFGKNVRPGTHAAALFAHRKISLDGLADTSSKQLKIALGYYPHIQLFKSAENLLKKLQPDIVSIATPPSSHSSLVKLAAIYKVKAIICEKPIAITVKDAESMIECCKKNGSLLFINHGRRFDPLLQSWASKVKKGIIGEITQATCYSYNGLFNNGTHTIDLMRLFLGDINYVQAWTNKKTTKLKNDKNADAIVYFKNDARMTLNSLPPNYGFSDCHLYGTKGRLEIRKLGYEIAHTTLIENEAWKGYFELDSRALVRGKQRSFMKSMIRNVVDCLDNGTKPLSSGEDGLYALKTLFAIQKSTLRNGKLVAL